MIGTILSAVVAPIISGLFKRAAKPYVEKALVPVVEKVMEIESQTKDLSNDAKHSELVTTILSNSTIVKIINKFGWNRLEVDMIIAFIVLMVKKNPTKSENRDKWDDGDTKVTFDFLQVIVGKWIHIFRRR
jgi:hypothetical protein